MLTELVRQAGVGLVSLTGPGGTGKTRLGLQAAAELVDAFADEVFVVYLAPLTDPTSCFRCRTDAGRPRGPRRSARGHAVACLAPEADAPRA